MARRTRDEKTKGRHESCFKVCGESMNSLHGEEGPGLIS